MRSKNFEKLMSRGSPSRKLLWRHMGTRNRRGKEGKSLINGWRRLSPVVVRRKHSRFQAPFCSTLGAVSKIGGGGQSPPIFEDGPSRGKNGHPIRASR